MGEYEKRLFPTEPFTAYNLTVCSLLHNLCEILSISEQYNGNPTVYQFFFFFPF